MRRATRGLSVAGVVAVVLGTLLLVASAQAVPIESFAALPSSSQAGGHPDIGFTFKIRNRQITPLNPCACSDAKDITVHLPAGLIGNPHAAPRCEIARFASERCPVDSQIGVVEIYVTTSGDGEHEGFSLSFLAPVFNLIPPSGEPGLLGFKAALVQAPFFEVIEPRTGSDYGLDTRILNIDHSAPLRFSRQVVWGVPASSVHDNLRFEFGQGVGASLLGAQQMLCDENGEPSTDDPATMQRACPGPFGRPFVGFSGPVASQSPEQPFLQNPTTCGVPLSTTLDVLGYDETETEASSPYPPTTGCSQLTFNPSQAIEPTTHAADSPSGAEFRLTVPQFESPFVPSPSELKGAVVTLPEGFSFAPNLVNGKTTCSDAQARFGTTEEAHCPEDSKIGTLSVETPVLPGVLPGAVYLGEPKPGNRFRLILVFDGFGVHVKLPGTATPNPQTGQIQIDFQNLPQAPFATFNAHFFGSERGVLDTPTQCGTYEVTNEWTPWDSALSNQVSRQFFTIDEGPNGTPCPSGPRSFHPGFKAASASSTAGAHTAFSLDLTRGDGEQNLASLKVTTPPGFAATLKGVAYCPQAAIEAAEAASHTGLAELASPFCPASSLIGELTTGAGPGTHPLYLPGKVYLAGPYKGSPLSFVFIVPAVAGGYDLGNVVVREGLNVNPETAQVTTAGTKLPQIFAGIPLRLRQILVNLNRPGFALNPTNCDPFQVKAEVFGSEGALSESSNHFQVSNCAILPFAPKLSMALSGSTKRTGDPGVKATLTYPGVGPYANVASTAVTLPPTEQIDNAHINGPCRKVVFNEGANRGEKCPVGSILGFARAETPLLDKPLEGPVYLRSAPENKTGLPDLVAALNGQIDIVLDGKITTVKGNRLRTTFAPVPDAPVSRFTLSLDGGHKGLLENNTDLCKHPLHATADIAGQNGKTANQNPLLSTPCARKQKRKAHDHRGRRTKR